MNNFIQEKMEEWKKFKKTGEAYECDEEIKSVLLQQQELFKKMVEEIIGNDEDTAMSYWELMSIGTGESIPRNIILAMNRNNLKSEQRQRSKDLLTTLDTEEK